MLQRTPPESRADRDSGAEGRISSNLAVRAVRISEAARIFDIKKRSTEILCAGHYDTATIADFTAACPKSEYELAASKGELLAAERGGIIAGFLWVSRNHDLRELFVDPDFAGRGIGSQLLGEGLRRMEEAGIVGFQITALLNSVPFYERHGFTVIEPGQLENTETGTLLPIMVMRYSSFDL